MYSVNRMFDRVLRRTAAIGIVLFAVISISLTASHHLAAGSAFSMLAAVAASIWMSLMED